MAAFRPDDLDERDNVLEDYALHVSPHSFYEWDGTLDAAITEASILCDGELSFEALEGGRPGSAAPAPSENTFESFIAAGEQLLATIERVFGEAA